MIQEKTLLQETPARRSSGVPVLEPPPAKPSRVWIWLLAVGAAAGLAYWMSGRVLPAASGTAKAVRTHVVRPGKIERVLRLTGTTAAGNSAMLIAPQLPGNRGRSYSSNDFKLSLVHLASPGATVRKGDVVAQFDRQFLEVRFEDLRADVRDRELSLRNLHAALDVRRKAYEQRIRSAEGRVERARLDLRTAPVRSAIQSEKFKLDFEEAEARLREVRREAAFVEISEVAAVRRYELLLEEARRDLRRAERNAERMVFRAPIDGVFIPERIRRGAEYREVEAGDELAPGFIFGQLFDLNTLTVEAALNQADIHSIRPGAKVRLLAEAFDGLVLPARVQQIGAMARAGGLRAEHVRNVPVRITLDKKDPRLVPNYSVAADVILESEQSAAVLPLESVFEDAASGSEYAWVRDGDEWRKQPIELGARNHIQAVVHSGVVAGDIVAAEALDMSPSVQSGQ